MTSKQRVLTAYHHREPDRVPIDYWAADSVTEALMKHFEFSDQEQLLERFHVDFRWPMPTYNGATRTDESGNLVNIWGVGRKGVDYGYATNHPMEQVTTVEEVEAYSWPDPADFDYDSVRANCEKYADYCILGGAWAPVLTEVTELVGMENFLTLMCGNSPVARALLKKVNDFYLEQSRRIFDAAEGRIDLFFMGEDYGCQQGLMISPAMWREFLRPGMKELVDEARSRGLPAMLHSCGSVRALIPDLIELGFTGLDPLQPHAAGMDPVDLKREFGDRLFLHGGIDTQQLLPFGTPEEVRREVKRIVEACKPGGGYAAAPSQHLLPEIPLENIIAMYDAAYEFGWY